jgi:hypothetical protein
MSRILKRPMFRKGGSTNEGIMHGLVDRKGYANGTSKEEILEALKTDAPRDTSLYEMLIGGGLNLVGGGGAGEGLMANIARSYKGPSETFFDRQRAAREYDRKLEQTAGQMSIQQQLDLEKIAAQKADDKSPLYNVFLEQAIQNGYDTPEATRIAEYQTIYKQQIQDQVGRESLGGILEFDLQDQKATKKQLPKLKNQVGKVFFDPYDGKFKVLTIKDGQLGFDEFSSVGDIVIPDLTKEQEKTVSKYDSPDFSDIGIGQQMLTP